jgi:hypothetical protein
MYPMSPAFGTTIKNHAGEREDAALAGFSLLGVFPSSA